MVNRLLANKTKMPINERRYGGMMRDSPFLITVMLALWAIRIMHCFIVRMENLSEQERNSNQYTIEYDKPISRIYFCLKTTMKNFLTI